MDRAPTDAFTPSTPSNTEPLFLPTLVEQTPESLKRGYLWNAVTFPGPVDAVIGAVLDLGPIGRWLGLEPAPKGAASPERLGISWKSSDAETFSRKAQHFESALRDPKATESGKNILRGGSNSNFMVTLDNGVSAIWTPRAGEKAPEVQRPNIPAGTQAKREEAAYLVDKRLGHFVRVPPAVSSGLEGRPGALKLFVGQGRDAKTKQSEALVAQIPHSDYRSMALFDHIIGNLDRHKGNFLLDQDAKPIPIDHGLSFPTKNGQQGATNFNFSQSFQLNEQEKTMLRKFSDERSSVEEELSSLLEPEAIQAMYQRVDRMLEIGWISNEWRT